MSCGSYNEDRRQKERRRRFNGKLGVMHSTRERQRERNTQKTQFQNNALTQCTYVCVQCTLLYKSFGGLTEVLSYFNALKEHLHKPQNIFLTEYLSSRHRSVPTDSVLGTRPHRSVPIDSVLGFLSRRSSASSADPADVELVISTRTMWLGFRNVHIQLKVNACN